jgi:DNA repair protein RecN (Recombination protein N)
MLKNLLIKNYALIRELELNPSTQLNIITGETGAGKSIMIGAVGLLLGKRADSRMLYDESEKCVVEGTFNLAEYRLHDFFLENELDYADESIVRREISPAGKSRAFINDTPVTLDVLTQLGSKLMDVHSQHDTLQLGTNTYQLEVIDAFAGNEPVLKKYRDLYQQFYRLNRQYQKMLKEAGDLRNEAEYHNFLYQELQKAALRDNEQEELEQELQILEHSEEIKLKLNEYLDLAGRSDFSAHSRLYTGQKNLADLGAFSEKFKALSARIESCLIELNDIYAEIEKEEELTEHDPQKIEFVKERLNLIYSLLKKHQTDSIAGLLSIQSELEKKVLKVENLDEELELLRKEAEQALKKVNDEANRLSRARKDQFETFCSKLEVLLRDLGMPEAKVVINHRSIEVNENGVDDISIDFSANKGMTPQPLKQVASGGEFSRLMFCVKFLLADKTALPTIIFDEVDTGISGEIALKMGKMMQVMSRNHQVLTITHLPQIAAKGDTHYYVYKDNQQEKTISRIRLLSEKERVDEIAKMIGGDAPSQVAFESARELMT